MRRGDKRTCRAVDAVPTRTLIVNQQRLDEPVLYLKRMSKGPMYRLTDFAKPRDRVTLVSIGRSPSNHIVVEASENAVSRVHCLLLCADGAVTVQDDNSKNHTLVNGVPVFGEVQLLPGFLLTVGPVTFLACGEQGDDQDPYLTVEGVHDLSEQSIELLGSQTAAAKAINVPQRTLSDWVRKRRFAKKPKR